MANTLSQKTTRRLELRGMDVSQDPAFARMAPWTRTTFVLCGTLIAIGTALAFPPLLWALMVTAALGAALPRHPFDAIYNHGIRHFTGTIALPKNPAPVRFACAMAAPWIAAIAIAFETGYCTTGYVLGFMMVSIAALVSATHFCIPSVIYQFLFGNRRLIAPA
ncbi:MAG: DUF4395 domain-containing protein, partial [Hyphomicrobiales bacterium]|nr:DUF4395 domain-containing protein [Hyphomicrobiales bacterium]